MKTTFTLGWVVWLGLAALIYPQAAQRDKRPSDALRQVANQQRKLLEELQRKAEQNQSQAEQREAMQEVTRQAAAQRAAPFKAADWKGDELLALIRLYEISQQYPPAIEAYRLYLKEPRDLTELSSARLGLLRALVEVDQIDEALKILNETKVDFVGRFDENLPARISLYKDLAVALRERRQFENALKFAREAYGFTKGPLALNPRWREQIDPQRASLAALLVVLLEQSGKGKEAGEFHQYALKQEFDAQSQWRDVYQAELISARLLGTPAPELLAARWLDGTAVKLSDLRGKVVLLDFWAMWCAPCVAAFPHYRELQSKHAGQGFEIIGVTRFFGRSDEKEELNREQEWQALLAFKRKHQLTYPIAVGKLDDVANEERYGVTGLPAVILLDRRGQVRELKRGGGNYRQLARRVAKLIEEK